MRYIDAEKFALCLEGDEEALANMQISSEECRKEFKGKTVDQMQDYLKKKINAKATEMTIENHLKLQGCRWILNEANKLSEWQNDDKDSSEGQERAAQFLKKYWKSIKLHKDNHYQEILDFWGHKIDWDKDVNHNEQ